MHRYTHKQDIGDNILSGIFKQQTSSVGRMGVDRKSEIEPQSMKRNAFQLVSPTKQNSLLDIYENANTLRFQNSNSIEIVSYSMNFNGISGTCILSAVCVSALKRH